MGGATLPVVSPEDDASAAESWLPEGAKRAAGRDERGVPERAQNGASPGEPVGRQASPDPAQWLPPGVEPAGPESPPSPPPPDAQASVAPQGGFPDLEDPREQVAIQKIEIAVLVRRVEELERQLAAIRRQSQGR